MANTTWIEDFDNGEVPKLQCVNERGEVVCVLWPRKIINRFSPMGTITAMFDTPFTKVYPNS